MRQPSTHYSSVLWPDLWLLKPQILQKPPHLWSCAQTGTAHTTTITSRNNKSSKNQLQLPIVTYWRPEMVPEKSLPMENLSTAQHRSLQGPPLHKHTGHSCQMKLGGGEVSQLHPLQKTEPLFDIFYILNIYKYNLTLKYASILKSMTRNSLDHTKRALP